MQRRKEPQAQNGNNELITFTRLYQDDANSSRKIMPLEEWAEHFTYNCLIGIDIYWLIKRQELLAIYPESVYPTYILSYRLNEVTVHDTAPDDFKNAKAPIFTVSKLKF